MTWLMIGFSGQFVADALAALGTKVVSGDEQYYKNWFSEFTL
jgi:hypothetical protein